MTSTLKGWVIQILVLFRFESVFANIEVPVFSNLVGKEVVTNNADYSYHRVIEKRLRVYSQDGLRHAATAIFMISSMKFRSLNWR